MTLNKVLDFDENNQKVVEHKLNYLWSYVRDVGQYCQTNFQSTNVDLATLRQGLDTHLQAHLPQHFQKVSEAMCETQSRNDAIFSNMQHSLQALSHQLEPITAIFPQLQQKLHEPPIKNPDLGQFITMEQFSTLATAFQEAQQRIFQLSGDSANFSHFSAKDN
jgi:hypothetical protein